MNLVIVESPAKCSKIQGFLGPGYRVVASMGHIRALEESLEAVGLDADFEPRFEFISTKASTLKNLREAAKGARQVYLAADDDREGEAIAYSVALLLNLPLDTTPRIVFHEITETAIKAALANPRRLHMNRVWAQQARSMLDLLIGFTLSPLLWSHVARGLSAGRCRFPRVAPLLLAACVAWLAAGLAHAKWGGGWGGGYGGFGGGWASTAQQGADMGLASVVRAQGYANLKNSEAAKNWEEAKTMEMQNRLRWTETYFEMRKVNREKRADEAGPPITHEQAISLAKMKAPTRLQSTQLDPVTGHIEYPLILTQDIYKQYRDRLDSLFANRAASGGSIRYEDFKAIQTTVSQFVEALQKHVSEYAAGDYGRARNFLDSLANEARSPAG